MDSNIRIDVSDPHEAVCRLAQLNSRRRPLAIFDRGHRFAHGAL